MGADAEAKQARMYRTLLEICLEFPACKSFSLWGFTDKRTWRGSNTHPLPYTANYQPKAAMQEMMDVLCDGCSVPITPPPPHAYYRLVGDCESVQQDLGDVLSVSSVAECWAQCDLVEGCDSVSTNGTDCHLKVGCQGSRVSPDADPVESGWFGYTLRPYNKLSTGTCASVTSDLSGNIGVTSHAQCLSKCDTFVGGYDGNQRCDGVSTNGNLCYLKKGCTGELSADPDTLEEVEEWAAYTLCDGCSVPTTPAPPTPPPPAPTPIVPTPPPPAPTPLPPAPTPRPAGVYHQLAGNCQRVRQHISDV